MRPELETIALIERYLNNELTAADREAFEARMAKDSELNTLVEEQRDLLQGIERRVLQQEVQQASKKYKLGKSLWKWGLGTVLVIAAAASLTLLNPFNTNSSENTLPEFNEKGEAVWSDADRYLPEQRFQLDLQGDTVIETNGGLVIAVPKDAFLDADGNVVTEPVDLEVKEALDAASILQAGLSTKSNGELLETGGMFYINARLNGKSLQINPDAALQAEVPTDERKAGMQLYAGERMADGGINWVEPKALERKLVPVNILDLNFYPPHFEDSLAAWGYADRGKEFTDSVFYSFTCEDQAYIIVTETDESAVIGEQASGKNSAAGCKSVAWDVQTIALGRDEYQIEITGKVPEGWHMYGDPKMNLGPPPVEIEITETSSIKRLGSLQKPTAKKAFEPNYKAELELYEGEVVFTQKVQLLNPAQNRTSVSIHYSIANASQVCPLGYVSMRIAINTESFTSRADTIKYETDSTTAVESSCTGIEPAQIQAIWNDKFQNTNLSTREFEARIPYLYQGCSCNLLDVYVDNLDKPLHVADSIAATMLQGAIAEKFRGFAARKDGRVAVKDRLAKKLSAYYAKKSKIYQEAIAETNRKFWDQQQKLDVEASDNIIEKGLADVQREAENEQAEFDLNLKEAYRQLGYGKVIAPAKDYYSASITAAGWNNVDKAVRLATSTRTTLDYTDPNGKKAVIRYEAMQVQVKDADRYDRLYVYLVGSKVKSYERLNNVDGLFSERLNELMAYKLVAVGYIGDQPYFRAVEKAKPGNIQIALEKNNAKAVEKRINRLCGDRSQADIHADLAHEAFLKEDNARKAHNQSIKVFRSKLWPVIFPCEDDGGTELDDLVDDSGRQSNQ